MPPPARISVALCTYNGGRYLRQQLDSVAAQTRPPAEIVAYDDGSTDDTLDLLNAYPHIRVHRNATRLGPALNFAAAIAACSGDVIACCDQDDVWHPDKLAVLGGRFDRTPDLGIAFSDADVIADDGRRMGYHLWDAVGFDPGPADLFPTLVRQNVVTGATLAFAARLRPLVLPVPLGWMHDGWIALVAAAVGPVAAVDEPLIQYRLHAEQLVGAERMSLGRQLRTARQMSRTVFADAAVAYQAALDRLTTWPGVRPDRLAALRSKVAHLAVRSAVRQRHRHRLPASIGELVSLRYGRYSLGWKSFAQDLLL